MVMEEDLVEKDGKNTRPEKPINMKKGVLITFYVESKAPCRDLLSKNNVDPGQEIVSKKRIYNNVMVMGSPSPSLLRHGYDRKAQLLAYVRKLRSSTNYQSHNPELPNKNLPSKTKGRWRRFQESLSRRIFSPSSNNQRTYEYIATLDTKQQTKNLNYYMKRLRCILKELSSCKWNWKCNKG